MLLDAGGEERGREEHLLRHDGDRLELSSRVAFRLHGTVHEASVEVEAAIGDGLVCRRSAYLSGDVETVAANPGTAVPSYLLARLPGLLPRGAEVDVEVEVYDESRAAVAGLARLSSAGFADVGDRAGRSCRARLFEQLLDGRVVVTTAVAEDGVVVRNDYGGLVAVLDSVRREGLRVPGPVVDRTRRFLEERGDLGLEGLVLWVAGPRGGVERALFPDQAAGADPAGRGSWVSVTARGMVEVLGAVRQGERLVARVHSHPLTAAHSAHDDADTALVAPGGLSVVVPEFGRALREGVARCGAYRLDARRRWVEVPAELAIDVG